jgi:predicted nucleic acid-binding protein
VSAVVSDTSPLQYLLECEAIEILPKLFGEVLIPPTVHRELHRELFSCFRDGAEFRAASVPLVGNELKIFFRPKDFGLQLSRS